jgi:hypothetical protein
VSPLYRTLVTCECVDPVAVDRAVKGAEIVIHCGAAMTGGWPEHKAAPSSARRT